YLPARLGSGLRSLGRTVGLGLAMNPQTGEILSLVTAPSFNNNLFTGPRGTSTTAVIAAVVLVPRGPVKRLLLKLGAVTRESISPVCGFIARPRPTVRPSDRRPLPRRAGR